jgi:hypothetical protein
MVDPDINPYPASTGWRRSPYTLYRPVGRSRAAYYGPRPARPVSNDWIKPKCDFRTIEKTAHVQVTEGSDEVEFDRLVGEWKREVRSKSLMITIAMHPAYQQMMGMGPKVLPFIFERIKRSDEKAYQWFWALAAITRQNPIPIEMRGKIREMTRAWLRWGQEHGYVVLD